MITKLKVKVGTFELDFEGEEEFIRKDLKDLLSLFGKFSLSPQANGSSGNSKTVVPPANGQPNLKLTTESIATRLNAKTGPDLLFSACARLGVVNGQESFSRKQILSEAKTATGYYTENVSRNISRDLRGLVKERKINEVASGIYSLNAEAKKELCAQLSG
jgi:hypothetical protein